MRGGFLPNDVSLDNDSRRLIILTGPNMAGKSTIMRQTALCAILAQAGSFVPASFASMSPVDRIFTRMGAYDYLSAGQRTFKIIKILSPSDGLRGISSCWLVLWCRCGPRHLFFSPINVIQIYSVVANNF
jgi:hypothetical protein